jgi:hypothetical protein
LKFRFSLQKALQWTEVEESAKRLEIARLLTEAEKLKLRRDGLGQNLRTLLENESIRFSSQWAPYAAVKVPADQAELKAIELRLREKESEIQTTKAALNRILLKRKGLESLREKRHRDHRVSEGRRDQKRLDDNYQILRARVKNG